MTDGWAPSTHHAGEMQAGESLKESLFEALKVHPQACYLVPLAQTRVGGGGGRVTRASECVKSQWPDKALTDQEKINFRCSRKGLVPRMSGVLRHWKRLPNNVMGSLPWKYLKIG